MIDMHSVKNLAIIASWGVKNIHNSYYCPTTHLLYLKQMTQQFKQVYLISSVDSKTQDVSHLSRIELKNLTIVDLPSYTSMLQAQCYKKEFARAIKEIAPKTDLFYCRVPDPFCWMPAQITNKPVIMHFVGDTADATKHNIHFSWLKKKILLAGYHFEYKHVLNSARKSTVYTNGTHLSKKLERQGVKAIPVVSSTITQGDLACEPLPPLSNTPFTIIYVGYLRYAKGMDTLMEVIKRLEERRFNYEFHIVGDGEMFSHLQQLVEGMNLEHKVHLHGHMDNRAQLFSLLQASDLFFFPSLSEGSPRVVIEAMSQGCPVLSTPVGSLPGCFEEGEEILFFPFNDPDTATNRILEVSKSLTCLTSIRNRAYQKVSTQFTMEQFIRTITTHKE